jgi:uncharacterized protein (TIGR03435 family)
MTFKMGLGNTLLFSITILSATALRDGELAQAAPSQNEQPAFEVATVKLTASMRPGGGTFLSPGRYTVRNRNLRYLIKDAFRIRDYQIVNAPTWIDLDNYDVEAKAPGSANTREMKVMLQTLLVDRFQLKFHWAETEVKGCVLEVAKGGPKFHEFRGPVSDNPADNNTLMRNGYLKGHSIYMAYLADYISDALQVPVVNRTELTGSYDITLEFFAEIKLPDDPGLVPESLPEALETQLGLKLSTRKLPIQTLVIDHVAHPSGN